MTKISHGRIRYFRLTAVPVVATAMTVMIAQSAQAAPVNVNLGTAANYAVLAASTVTNTGGTVISGGDLGLSPGTSVTGLTASNFTPPATEDFPDSAQAQTDLTTAYNQAMNETPTVGDTGESAFTNNQTLTPGVYNAPSGLLVDGAVTLNAEGNPNAVFIFQVDSALTVGSQLSADITLAGGASACNVFWQVGSSATLDSVSNFVGSILASASITVNSGDTIDGRLLASTAAVTLIDDAISAPNCSTTVATPLASGSGLAAAAGLAGLGGLGWFLVRRRRTALRDLAGLAS
jgi:adhesin HecA-like repeat protein